MNRRTYAGALLAVGLLGMASSAAALEPVSTGGDGLALGGYDAVAYFTEGKPVAGRKEFQARWNGATWQFSSVERREAFLKAPERYAPQYGGYCAYAVAKGASAPGDPTVWKVVDGKLYVNKDADVQTLWSRDVPGHIVQADRNWPAVLKK
jgi:YHS domain-containing protein